MSKNTHRKIGGRGQENECICVPCVKYSSYQRLMLMPSQHAGKISQTAFRVRLGSLSYPESPLSARKEVPVIYRNHWSCMKICITCVPGSVASHTFIFKGAEARLKIIIIKRWWGWGEKREKVCLQ